MTEEYLHKELTDRIIGCSFKVHNELGTGFLEKVYRNALAVELKEAAVPFEQEYPLSVSYRGHIVDEYVPDLIVDQKVIVELKAVSMLSKPHEVQLVNYLKVTGLQVGLLINFGKSVEVKRKIRSKNI
ncbi:MAG: GxxExxY protein [Planctomycetes bacterium]|nr:GxxExxY protein [Planctomycetota bacterium]